MGKSYTPQYRVEYSTNDNSNIEKMAWHSAYGKPTLKNLLKWQNIYNTSFKEGGVNHRCSMMQGFIIKITNCKIIDQHTSAKIIEIIA